jgi:hypothetical protein
MRSAAHALIACIAISALVEPLSGQEVRMQAKDIPRELTPSIDRILGDAFQRNCAGTTDAFDHHIYDPDSILGRREHIYQLADFGWYVSRKDLTTAEKRNGMEFRGTLVVTASAYRTYDSGSWTQWFDESEHFKFNIKKDKEGSWVLEPFPLATLFVKLTCDEIGKLLTRPSKGSGL